MIEYEIDWQGRSKMNACGTNDTLFADTMVLVRSVYRGILPNDPSGAETFIQCIISMLSDRSSVFYKEDSNG